MLSACATTVDRDHRELLRHGTGMPVAEVAARCGFDDVSYFTRTFRAQRQLTPTAFRQASWAGPGETAP